MATTIIRVALASVVVVRNGQRAVVPAGTPFYFLPEELETIKRANPNYLRRANDVEVRGAAKFDDLKGRKPLKAATPAKAPATPKVEPADTKGVEPDPEPASEPVAGDTAYTRAELEDLKVAELREIAAGDERISVPGNASKADLIEAIYSVAGQDEDDGL